jgi:hypothetical protein
VAKTGQPYAFTGDDPLNATDPLGLQGSAGLVAEAAWNKATAAFAAYCTRTHNKGPRVVHGAHCGQHWYQSISFPRTTDVIAIAGCLTGFGCIPALAVTGVAHEIHDASNHCSAGQQAADSTISVFGLRFGAISRLGEGAFEGLGTAKAAFRVHQSIPGIIQSGVSAC